VVCGARVAVGGPEAAAEALQLVEDVPKGGADGVVGLPAPRGWWVGGVGGWLGSKFAGVDESARVMQREGVGWSRADCCCWGLATRCMESALKHPQSHAERAQHAPASEQLVVEGAPLGELGPALLVRDLMAEQCARHALERMLPSEELPHQHTKLWGGSCGGCGGAVVSPQSAVGVVVCLGLVIGIGLQAGANAG